MKKYSEEELKQKLTQQQYHILRQKETEAPFTGKLLHNKEKGQYVCPVCGSELFSSDTKFDSGSGWPSFYDVAKAGAVKLEEDSSHGMSRIEAPCATCGSHLGHVFNDAHDQPTGTRFCINSASLKFMPTDKTKQPVNGA